MYIDYDELDSDRDSVPFPESVPCPNVYAISDVHSDFSENLELIQQIQQPPPGSVVNSVITFNLA